MHLASATLDSSHDRVPTKPRRIRVPRLQWNRQGCVVTNDPRLPFGAFVSPSELSANLHAVANSNSPRLRIASEEPTRWQLNFAEVGIIDLKWATSPDRLAGTVLIGSPHPQRVDEVFSVALSTNALCQEDDGVLLSLMPAQGALRLHQRWYADELEGDGWLHAIERLANTAAWWLSYVQAAPGAASSAHAARFAMGALPV
jgi:hypothetical protein